MSEPHATAAILAVGGALIAVSVMLSRVAGRISVPVALLFLTIGVIAGAEGIGGLAFADYGSAFRLGTAALALILFDGGLNTSFAAVKRALAPAAGLATLGVVVTAAVVAVGARLLGWSWGLALLFGAVVSSTDAAAVFSVLRGSGVALGRRVATTLELESGLNDPLAVLLTLTLTDRLLGRTLPAWRLVLEMAVQLAVGVAGGAAFGWGGRWLLRRLRPGASGLFPVFTLALAYAAFGATTLAHGSGFLAVYMAAIIIGNGNVPYRAGLVHVHDALAWIGQVVMFLALGALSVPSRLLAVGWGGVALALLLAFVARPLAAALCLFPLGFRLREVVYVGWVGLRGAVPIILATFPVLAGVPGAEAVFDLVFFVVVVNAIIPGATVRWVTRRLGVAVERPPPPKATIEITAMETLGGEVLSFFIDRASAVAGARISELPFPDAAAIMLVVRGEELLAAKGDTVLAPGDHVHVFCRPQDKAFVYLLFGQPEES
jgi:potassium/hydrogen antiporter